MTSFEQQLRAANPVPDPANAMDRATYLSVLERVRPADSEPTWQRHWWRHRQTWQFAGASLLLTLALGVGYLWGQSQQPVVVAGDPPAVPVARAYIDARNERDADAALALLAEGAIIVEYPVVRDVAELPALFEYLDLVDEEFTIVACDPATSQPEVVVCLYEMNNRLIERAGINSIPGHISITTDGHRIVNIENAVDYDAYDSSVVQRWSQWLDNTLDEGALALNRGAFQLDRAVLTPRLDELDSMAITLDDYTSTD